MRAFLLLFVALWVFPAAADYCDSKSLRSRVSHCEENGRFQEAAVACIKRFQGEVSAAAAVFGAALLTPAKAAGQQESQGSARRNYGKLESALDDLIGKARSGLAALTEFERNVVFPEDVDSEEAVRGDLDRFLFESDCYRETYEVLFTVRADFQEKLDQLAAARGLAAGGKEETKAREGLLQGGGVTPSADSGLGTGGGQPVPRRGAQDPGISGIKEGGGR